MNYFAHGIRYLDRPYFLVGTAMPDLLSVVDRQVRFRSRVVEPVTCDPDLHTAEFAAGVLQHLEDDRWFHKTRGFFEVTSEVTRLIRRQVDGDDRFRASFLGHIVTELLLDRFLIADHPGALDRYYEAWSQIDRDLVQRLVNRMSREPTNRLIHGLRLFQEERFLYDYVDSKRLLYRLNQVMRRVKLPPLPEATGIVLAEGEAIVRDRWRDLLPSQHFQLSRV